MSSRENYRRAGRLALVLVFMALPLLSACGGGGDDTGVKRFDRVTMFNMTDMPIEDVRIKLTNEGATDRWWSDTVEPGEISGIQPEEGFDLGNLDPGKAVGLALNHAEEEGLPFGVHTATCTVTVDPDGPGGSGPIQLTCTIEGGQWRLHSATFYLLRLPDAHPNHGAHHGVKLVGEAMTQERLVKEYTRE